MSSTTDISKLKVVELRAELSAKGLDTKGNKPVLIQRLKEALEKEQEQGDESVNSTLPEEDDADQEEQKAESPVQPPVSTDVEVKESKEMEIEEIKETPAEEPKKVEEEPVEEPPTDPPANKVEEEKETCVDASEDTKEQNGEHIVEEVNQEQEVEETKCRKASRWAQSQDEVADEQENCAEKAISEIEEGVETVDEKNDSRGDKRKHSPSPSRTQRRRSKSPVKEDEPNIDNDKVQLNWYDSDLHLQVDKETFLSAKPYQDGAFGYVWAGVRATHGVKLGKAYFEVKLTEELKWEDIKHPERGRKDRDRSNSRKSKSRRDSKSEDKKHEAKCSDAENDKEQKAHNENKSDAEESEEVKNDDKTADDEEAKEKCSDITKTEEVESDDKKKDEEATHEAEENTDEKKSDIMEVEDKEADKIDPHLIRVGWSLCSTSMQLGECEHSYGYESSGKFVNKTQFVDYGITFAVGDVVGAFININDESVSFTYSVNGEVQPVALTFPRSELPEESCAFFPHVLSKNYSFEMNLGNREEPWFPNKESLSEYVMLEKVEDKVAGPARPEKRDECEVIMMCGLPASGKSTWVRDYVAKNPEKRYTVLGISFLLDRMTVNGNPLKNCYKSRWHQVMDKLAKSLNKLVDLAALRRRNYVLDQTNIYPSAQRRKMRSFEGFKRRAVVVVASDEDQAKRDALQEEQDGKDAPDTAVLEMKACMSIPRVGDFLEEVDYAELGEEEAKAVVQKYNSLGREAGYGSNNQNQIKSRHYDNRNRWQNREYRGGNYREQRSYHSSRYERGGGTPTNPRHSNWYPRSGGGGGGGGWGNRNDRRDSRGPSSGGHRDFRGSRGGSRHHDRGAREGRQSGNFNRRLSYTPGRNQSGNWHSGGGNWSGNQNAWPSPAAGQNQSWQNWNQGQGNWGGGQSQGHYKQYNQQQSYGQPQQQQQGYGSYSNWSYYGQYAQNWNTQGQATNSEAALTTNSSQYNQMTPQQQQQAWAQYSQQYTQSSQQPVQK